MGYIFLLVEYHLLNSNMLHFLKNKSIQDFIVLEGFTWAISITYAYSKGTFSCSILSVNGKPRPELS